MEEFWSKKKVLVTGHTGFVGTWFCLVLEHFGAKVIGFSLPEESEALYSRVKRNLNLKNYYGNLEHKEEIEACLTETQPDYVYHFAAYGFIQECLKEPKKAYCTNIIGTLHLLQAIEKQSSVQHIIIASSDKVYANKDKQINYFKENHMLGGIDTYSCSKTAEDMLAQSYYKTYLQSKGITMTILRPSNILGGGDHNKKRLIPYILEQVRNGKEPRIRNPKAIRPWQHILDMVDAYLTVVQTPNTTVPMLHIYNVGPKRENIVTVEEIVQLLIQCSGMVTSYQIELSPANTKHLEYNFLGLSIQKIKSELHWQPKKNIRSTLHDLYEFEELKETIGFYEACQRQLKDYYL